MRVHATTSVDYELLSLIGSGAMGEVWRVRDRRLQRTMAMKILRHAWTGDADIAARFIEEAQATAQLQHPGIVPVHEIGTLSDGRLYFTMKEVRGRTFLDVIEAVHREIGSDFGAVGRDGWSHRRLVEVFRAVCDAVAYAHSRGVIHRDLKPHNIMVGDFGEVLVLDWGLALVIGRSAGMDAVSTHRSEDECGDGAVTLGARGHMVRPSGWAGWA
ncbi:MAG: serine/threonine-protein kinase [Lysobacterales bacterium]